MRHRATPGSADTLLAENGGARNDIVTSQNGVDLVRCQHITRIRRRDDRTVAVAARPAWHSHLDSASHRRMMSSSFRRLLAPRAISIKPREGTSTFTPDGVHRMNVRPLHDRIIVKRLEEGEQQVGGIIIPDTAKEKPQQGKVIAAGSGKVKDDGKRTPLDVKSGDLILFGKYSGQEIKLDGEEYLIMREDEVLAIIEGGTKKKK
jgi:chaperonin GroES